jgi:hypothetical protein
MLFSCSHHNDVPDSDLEIEEAMDDLDEEEMTPTDESISTLVSDLKSCEDLFYSRRSRPHSRRRSRSS